jgi:hypothetical protein
MTDDRVQQRLEPALPARRLTGRREGRCMKYAIADFIVGAFDDVGGEGLAPQEALRTEMQQQSIGQ